MVFTAISTEKAPLPIGAYSQAVQAGNWVFLSGQIGKDSLSGVLKTQGPIAEEIAQVFENLKAVAEAAGGCLAQILKLTIFLTDLKDFAVINESMIQLFNQPYPARSTVQVAALPAGARVEIEAIMYTSNN